MNLYNIVLFLETIVCPALHTLEIDVCSAWWSSETLARLQTRIRVTDLSTPPNQSVTELRMLRCVRFVIIPGKFQGIVDIRAEQDREAAHIRAALPDAWERGILQFVY